ncbi:hypothetical protein FKM82_002473 [Ascaphus truei]
MCIHYPQNMITMFSSVQHITQIPMIKQICIGFFKNCLEKHTSHLRISQKEEIIQLFSRYLKRDGSQKINKCQRKKGKCDRSIPNRQVLELGILCK